MTLDEAKSDYIIKVNAEGFHFSRNAFTDNELAKIREFAMDLRNKRNDTEGNIEEIVKCKNCKMQEL